MNLYRAFEKYMIKPFTSLANTGTLIAIRNSFILTLPVVMAGSLAVLINNLPISWYQTFMISIFGETWKNLGGYIYSGTFSIMSFIVCMSLAYNLAVKYNRDSVYNKTNPLIVAVVAFASLIVIMQPQESLSTAAKWMGVSGLFLSILISIFSARLYLALHGVKAFKLNFFSEEADFAIPNAMSALIPAVITIIVFAFLRTMLTFFNVHDLFGLIYTLMQLPFQGVADSKITALLYIVVIQTLWFFGIHGGNVLDPVTKDLYISSMDKNITAFATNEPMTHIFTKTFFDVFVFAGGAGATICLLVAIFFFSKRGSTRKIGQVSLLPALFNINEIITFGLPIVLNPFFIIPFILCPVVMGFLAYFFTYIGVLPHTNVYVDWTTPPILNAYYATGSLKGPLVQVLVIFVGSFIYLPFVLAYDKNK